ncbi:MAG: hypothetical protein KDM91_17995 [Verrucomicrobiae bacterium]|nr:hypothetical protein [Verrucomicrobiae bacterium]MCP5540463.1 hypothetical protein [Akkermansiaceae bacterium]
MKSWLAKCLTLLTVLTVSGGHLACMQAGAWALMTRDHAGAMSLPEMAGAFLSGSQPCKRCLLTMEATVKGLASEEGKAAPAAPELGLVPAESRPITLSPPAPDCLAPAGDAFSRTFTGIGHAPPVPPPDFA